MISAHSKLNLTYHHRGGALAKGNEEILGRSRETTKK